MIELLDNIAITIFFSSMLLGATCFYISAVRRSKYGNALMYWQFGVTVVVVSLYMGITGIWGLR